MTFAIQILCVLGLMSSGYFARRRGWLTAQGTSDLARISIAFIYPALIVTSITRLSLDELITNRAMPLWAMVIAMIGFSLGLIAVQFLGRVSKVTARAFLFQCLINNYLFLPLPLILFRFGERGVALLVFSSVGYELILWTLGVFLFTREATLLQRVRSLLSPPFIALMLSLGFVIVRGYAPWGPPPDWITSIVLTVRDALSMMGQATIAISVLIAGSHFAVMQTRMMLSWRVWLVSAIRLLAVPLLMIPLLHAFPMDPMARGILIIIAVMPSAMASMLFSERYGGDTDFIAGGLLLTHLWAVFTVPLFLAWGL